MKPDRESVRDILGRHLKNAGLFTVAHLSRTSMLGVLDARKTSETIRSKYELNAAESAVIACLRYSEGDFPLPDWAKSASGASADGTLLGIGRFARANWYAELSGRLKMAVENTVSEADAGGRQLPAANRWHRLVNSGLPEKALAEKSGAGRIGKNQLLIARSTSPGSDVRYSSAVVVGILLCPVDLGGEGEDSVPDLCGGCTKCIDACPTMALGTRYTPGYSRLSCIQHWTTEEGELPERIRAEFGSRLYGCDTCLEACPHFRTDAAASTSLGRIGPMLPTRYILTTDDALMKKNFAGTALDRAWMSKEAFRRNARLVTGETDGY